MRQVKVGFFDDLELTDVEEGVIIRMINYNSRIKKKYNPKTAKRKKIVSKSLSQSNGWLTHKEIEHNQTGEEPKIYDEDILKRKKYATTTKSKTTSNRKKYLRGHLKEKKLVENRTRYFKGSNGERKNKHETVYKVIPNSKTFFRLFSYFEKFNNIYYFSKSDYYKDNQIVKEFQRFKPLYDWIDEIIVNESELADSKKELKNLIRENIQYMIPPSMVKSIYIGPADEFVADFGIEELWKSFLVYDYTQTHDEVLKNVYLSIIELIDLLPTYESIDKLNNHIDKIKNNLHNIPNILGSGKNKKQTGGQNEEKK
jgi:hypothetical protein